MKWQDISLGSLIFIASLVLAAPAAAETAAPTIGWNSEGVSIYFLEYAWPDEIEINALEFVRLNINVEKTGADFRGSVNLLGVFCLIPGLSGSVVCPPSPGEGLGVPAPEKDE